MTAPTPPAVPPYRIHGRGAPLVLISGLGGKGTSWRPFLQAAAAQFSVITHDIRGAGETAPLAGPISIRELAGDVLLLLDHLGLEQVPVMGRSMGGMIAQELALLAPERIAKLALVSTSGRVDPHLAAVFRHWAAMAEAGVPAAIRHRESMLWCLGSAVMHDAALVEPYMRAKLAGDRPRDYAHQARACATHDALDRLAELDVSTLIVSGTDDRLTPPPHAEALAKKIPASQLALIPGAGHMVYLEAPDAFAREVMRFLC